jgi:ribonuclease Z
VSDALRIALLGSGGFMPTDRRETACALLRRGSSALLIDAGTGARRLVEAPELLDGADRLHVVLTHFHLDHTIGLFYLTDIEPPLEVWGGGEALEKTPTAELVARLLAPPFSPPSFSNTIDAIHELAPPGAEIGGFRVRCRVQPKHANPTLALRVDDELAWCTDTALDEDNREFVRGVRTLFHESFYAAATSTDPGHTAAGEIAQLAKDAEVGRLVLIHVNPELEDEQRLLELSRPVFAATEVGGDGQVY